MNYVASAVFPCGPCGPQSKQPRCRTNRFPPSPSCLCAGACRFGATLGCCPANGQRQLAGERVQSAIRLRTPDLPRFSLILLRRDWRPASRSTRGCAGHASTIWLTPNVRLADARIAFCWVAMSVVFRGTATCCSPTPGPSPATMLVVFGEADLAGEGGVFVGAVPGVGTGGANPGLW